MLLFYGSFIALLTAIGVMIPRLFWSTITEGQLTKQSFVGHMIQSFYDGNFEQGFPLRFFFEPGHPGVIPWAEEVPLYHVLVSALSHLLHLNPINTARGVSFAFSLVFLWSVFEIAKRAFPNNRDFSMLTVALFAWFPGFQIYGTSVIPDMAMLGMMALALQFRLKGKGTLAYLSLMIAALFKYFAVFIVLALFIFDCLEKKDIKSRAKSFLLAAISALPPVVYIAYFVLKQIPNPITEYRTSNGYGHLAGPFLFQGKFYLRSLLWVFVKNPTLVASLLAFFGIYRLMKKRKFNSGSEPVWRLLFLFYACYTLFALAFASSFFVHDYYALPFILPVGFWAMHGLRNLKGRILPSIFVGGIILIGFSLSHSSTHRGPHYEEAAQSVRQTLASIPDQSRDQLCVFITDYSLPPIPVLSKKSGWTFEASHFADQKAYYEPRLEDSRTKAVVVYLQGKDQPNLGDWLAPLNTWTKVKDLKIDGNPLLIFQKKSGK